jgi:peptidase MA superfamily protein
MKSSRASCPSSGARLLRALFVLVFALVAVAGAAAPVARAADPITVDAVSATANFPTEVVFALKAHAPGSRITRAVVSYRYTGEPTTGDVSATFSPGASVTTQARLNTRTHYMPPGVAISYYWSIDDDAGHHLDTAPQVIRYEDKRYAWQVAEDTAHNLRVHWYKGGVSFGQALRKTAVAGLDRLQANFGLTLTLPVEVWVYPDDASFTSALPPNLPEWVGGKAFVQNGVVAALIDPSFDADHEIRRIVPHELSHLVVYQATLNPYNTPPAWLDEGLAIYNQEVQDSEMEAQLKDAAGKGALLRLRTLQGSFPADPEAASLSYAESASAARFMISHYGAAKVGAVLAAFRDGVTYDEALQAGIGTDTDGVDSAWRAALPYKQPQVAATASPAPATALPAAETPALPVTAAPTGAAATAAPTATITAAPAPLPAEGSNLNAILLVGAACVLVAAGTIGLLAVRRRG